MQPALFSTKLFIPPAPPGLVARPRLSQAMDAAWQAGTRLIVLSAPAGYGKTTLLSAWIHARQTPCAWVSLDSGDNDPARFCLYLLRALEPHLPGLAGELLPVMNFPQSSPTQALPAGIINHAAGLAHPLLLVLDDYHTIQQPEIHDLLQALVTHSPPQLRLAVLSREDPPLALARLRARRQMLELRAADLSFSHEETQELLVEQMQLPLSPEQIQSLAARTEGWAAGLQLAGLSINTSSRPDDLVDEFGGSNRFVLDYLAEEVLSRLPAGLRDFLCQSALLNPFCAGLCDAALQRTDSQEMIRAIETANLFLVPLDDRRQWFRYHHLLTDILAAEVDPENKQQIYQRAAAWHAAQDTLPESIRYALAAGDFDAAGRAILRAAIPAAESGQLRTLLGWLDALPLSAYLAYPDLAVYRAWFLVYNGQFVESMQWLQAVQNEPAVQGSPARRAILSTLSDYMGLAAGGALHLDRLMSAVEEIGDEFPSFHPLLHLAIGQAQHAHGHSQAGRASFTAGMQRAAASGQPLTGLMIRNNLAFLVATCGSLPEAEALLQSAIQDYTAPSGQLELPAGIPLIALGAILYEAGRLEEAERYLQQGLRFIERLGLYEVLAIPANSALTYVCVDQGRFDEAWRLNEAILRRGEKVKLQAAVVSAHFDAAAIHLRLNQPEHVEEWARQVHAGLPSGPLQTFDDRLLVLAEFYLAQNRPDNALEILTACEQFTRCAGWLLDLGKVRLLAALALSTAGRATEAEEALGESVQLAQKTGFIQMFRARLPHIAPLLRRVHAAAPALVDALLNTAPPAPRPQALAEPLTGREQEILRLVAAGLSNQDIAAELYLTTGTVKWYLNQVFGKLGVRRRTEAVARSRELELF